MNVCHIKVLELCDRCKGEEHTPVCREPQGNKLCANIDNNFITIEISQQEIK